VLTGGTQVDVNDLETAVRTLKAITKRAEERPTASRQ